MALNWTERESDPLNRVLLYSMPQPMTAELSKEKHCLIFWLLSLFKSEDVPKAKCWCWKVWFVLQALPVLVVSDLAWVFNPYVHNFFLICDVRLVWSHRDYMNLNILIIENFILKSFNKRSYWAKINSEASFLNV